MATVRQRREAGRVVSRKGEAIADLMLEVAQFFFACGPLVNKPGSSRAGAAAPSVSCAAWRCWVPHRAPDAPRCGRPAASMQRLADELAAAGSWSSSTIRGIGDRSWCA